MPKQITTLLNRLKKPSVTLSIISQIVSIFILMGYNINENKVMAIMTLVCSILVTLGIMQNPDTKKKGYGDDLLTCSADGTQQHHVTVNGQLVCADCGAVHDPASDAASPGGGDDVDDGADVALDLSSGLLGAAKKIAEENTGVSITLPEEGE